MLKIADKRSWYSDWLCLSIGADLSLAVVVFNRETVLLTVQIRSICIFLFVLLFEIKDDGSNTCEDKTSNHVFFIVFDKTAETIPNLSI